MTEYRLPRRDFLRLGAGTAVGGAAALSSLPAFLAACSIGQQQATNQNQTTLTIGISGDTQTLDPDWGQDNRINETLKNVYAVWTRYPLVDSGDGYQKADTSRFEGEAVDITVGGDGTTLHCTIKGSKFASGNPITSDDFLYVIQRAYGVKAGTAFDFSTINVTDPATQFQKIDDRNFTLKLSAATPILGPTLRDQDTGLMDSKLVKAHATADDPWAQKWLAKNGAFSGAYAVETWNPGTSVVLKANPNYWGPQPFFKKVVLQEIPSEDNRVLLIKQGTIDIAANLSLDAIQQLKGQSGIKIVSAESAGQDRFYFVHNKPPFDNLLLRQAVAYATPYEQIISGVYHGDARVAKGVWPTGSRWFQEKPWPYKNDLAKAKALLAQAGKPNGFNFVCEISLADNQATQLAVLMQTALAQIGVKMDISKVDGAVFQQHLGQKSAQAFIQTFGGGGPYIDDPYFYGYLFWATFAVINFSAYKNDQVDQLTRQLGTELDPTKRQQLVGDMHAVLNDTLVYLPLADTKFFLPMRSNVQGFVFEPDGLLTYKYFKRG